METCLHETIPERLEEILNSVSVLLEHGCIKEAMSVATDLVYDTPGGMAYYEVEAEFMDKAVWMTVNYRLHHMFEYHKPQIKSFIAIHKDKDLYNDLTLFCLDSVLDGDPEFIGDDYEAPGLSIDERFKLWLKYSDETYGDN